MVVFIVETLYLQLFTGVNVSFTLIILSASPSGDVSIFPLFVIDVIFIHQVWWSALA